MSETRVLSDAVICGHNGLFIAALGWLNQTEARRVLGRDDDMRVDDPALVAHLTRALCRVNAGTGSAMWVARLLLLADLPDIDAGEIIDKGYINQRAVRERRVDAVQLLLGEPVSGRVITPAAA